MKITMYELLGLVKDGKAPKKIKYKDKIYYYHEGYDFKYMYNSSNYNPMDRDKSLFTFDSYKMKDGRQCWDSNTAIDFLNDEVEILEEEKKVPEKLEILNANEHSKEVYYENYSKEEISLDIETLQIWVNEIIDYLKSKGE